MKSSTRILISVMALLAQPSTILGGAPVGGDADTPPLTPAVVAAVASPLPTLPADVSEPTGTTVPADSFESTGTPAPAELSVVGGTARQRQAVDEAIGHFLAAGLEPPTILIEIHPTDAGCDGYDGSFRAQEWRLDVCNPHWMIVLHELAHAWDYANLTDETHRRFMDLRGLAGWNDPAIPWKERGVEDLAEIIVWGLRSLSSPDRVPSDAEKEAAFELITGIDVAARRLDMGGDGTVHRWDRGDSPEFDPEFDVWR